MLMGGKRNAGLQWAIGIEQRCRCCFDVLCSILLGSLFLWELYLVLDDVCVVQKMV